MISFDIAARQMGGAMRMAFDAKDWRDRLSRSIDDVFESFAAFLFSAPLVVLATVVARRAAIRAPDIEAPLYETAPLAALIAFDLATFALDWAASLFLLVMIARAMGAGRHAADVIVGFNWVQPIIAAVQLPALALMAASASRGVGVAVALPGFAFSLALIFGVVRRGIGAERAQSGAIVFMLMLAGVAIDLFGAGVAQAIFPSQS